MIDLADLQLALYGGKRPSDRRARRLVDLLADDQATATELAPILRQVLKSAETDVASPRIELPRRAGLAEELSDTGLAVERLGLDGLLVRAPALPGISWLEGRREWLDLATVAPGALVVESGEVSTWSRVANPVPSDPAFERATAHQEHVVAAQREAVRAVAVAPPGAVTHVVLPTGAGKTIVGVLPSLLDPTAQVVVVVPTVAIALDQERAVREASGPGGIWEGTPAEVAWHGGTDAERRARIRQRLLDGEQRVLFTSPESLVASLEPTLLATAQRGLLHTIVVDEAHLIAQWGLDFRPEMQLIASVRDQLLQATSIGGHEPIRTVLLTATLDEHGFMLNRSLFPSRGPTTLVGAPALRTEPRYLRFVPEDQADLDARLLEVLAVVPRPVIIYATRKAEAERVTEVIRSAGYRRVESFTGDTDSASRAGILGRWRGDDGVSTVDIVVGTAAFGLGVDQPDVRTVIHVEAPPSIGAYYQEVGRGGRDGHAAVAILLAPRASLTSSLSIGDVTLLRDETVLRRWKALRTTRQAGEPDTVDVRVLPEHIRRATDANELWNKNTLVLMERAGLIRLVPQPLPEQADEELWEHRRGRVGLEVLTKLTDDRVLDAIRRFRHKYLDARVAERAAVSELLDGETCFGKLFADAYAFDVADGPGSRIASRPVIACSGCPGCQRSELKAADPPVATFPPARYGEVEPSLQGMLSGARLLVLHDETEWARPQWANARGQVDRLGMPTPLHRGPGPSNETRRP